MYLIPSSVLVYDDDDDEDDDVIYRYLRSLESDDGGTRRYTSHGTVCKGSVGDRTIICHFLLKTTVWQRGIVGLVSVSWGWVQQQLSVLRHVPSPQ